MRDAPNIVSTIRREAMPYAGRHALTQGGRSRTYADLFDDIGRVANDLRAQGVRPGDLVAFVSDDSIEYVVAALAVLEIGAVLMPLSTALSSKEYDEACLRISPDVSLSIASEGSCAVTLHERTRRSEVFYGLGPAFIRFSSGTTGASKGVLLSHQAVIDRTDAAQTRLRISEKDRVVWLLSMSFHFVVTILLFLRKGAEIVLCGDGFPNAMFSAMREKPCTFIYASPFHYAMMNSSAECTSRMLSSVRMAVSTASALGIDTAQAFKTKFGKDLSQAYGIIEIGLPCVNDAVTDGTIASVGTVSPDYECLIRDPDADGNGVVLFRGKGMYNAYVSPWKLREDWFDTGDIGAIRGRFLFLKGREKTVINFAGMKVFPQDVETVLNAHPAVAESLVSGKAHALYGQLPVAALVAKPNIAKPSDRELRQFCLKSLDAYKVPKEFVWVETLPKTASGKLQRHQA